MRAVIYICDRPGIDYHSYFLKNSEKRGVVVNWFMSNNKNFDH